MRSILIHLWNTTLPAVESAFPEKLIQTTSEESHDKTWVLKQYNEVYLYINFYTDGPAELEDWNTRFDPFGGPPPVSVVVDISGRHDGWDQTREFALWILSKFQGVAEDDSAIRFWTREEILADLPINGQKFGAWRNYLEY